MFEVVQETGLLTVLNVGSGGDPLPHWLSRFKETRLDIDPRHSPDIISDMKDIGDIGSFDVVYSSHSLEHLYPHEVGIALGNFFRVLKSGGKLVLFVPDLEGVSPDDEPLFVSPVGPICGLDLFYGYRPMLEKHPNMAHHTCFTEKTLRREIELAGFVNIQVKRLFCHNLIGGGVKP